jgi:ABC-2 type transport system ATP-binding protein
MTRPAKEVVFSAKNLKKRFGDFTAVDEISFDIFKGEVFGFLGPNGAGKTTTIRMICGLLPITAGDVLIHGKKTGTLRGIKSLIGICPQENVHWSKLSCLEQLLFMGSMYDLPYGKSKDRAHMLLDMLGLTEKAKTWASKLSGGMKRRLNIALALIHDPGILVLDEPEAGLDPQSRILVREFIKNLAQEKTVILTTHNMDEADRLADRVAIIDRGKLLLLDSPLNLKRSIGAGDTLEITLETTALDEDAPVFLNLKATFKNLSFIHNQLTIQAPDLVGAIPEISEQIHNAGLRIQSMMLRENTLEDVFIHLTGRRLRQ